METKFFVFRAFRYKESKSWEYKLVGMYDTMSEAKQAYYANMSAIIKPTNDFAMCVIVDSFSNQVVGDYDDTHVEEAPVETPVEEG